jgi:hypothetical protein
LRIWIHSEGAAVSSGGRLDVLLKTPEDDGTDWRRCNLSQHRRQIGNAIAWLAALDCRFIVRAFEINQSLHAHLRHATTIYPGHWRRARLAPS